jgi:hypothetical protein
MDDAHRGSTSSASSLLGILHRVDFHVFKIYERVYENVDP